MLSIFGSRNLLIFTAVVVAQGGLGYYLNARQEYVPPAKALTSIPQRQENWEMVKEWPMEPEVQAVLRADDSLSRHYVRPATPMGVGLFIAFFRTQRAGVAPHSPKNCLPGNGWVAEKSTVVQVPVPGRAEPVEANFYLIQRGDNKSVVYYWYQSHGRTVADEYRAKFYVMADAIRLNRTDTALVRITVAVGPDGVEAAQKSAVDFIRDFSAPIFGTLPG
jgi:EpsI family protein